ncbi:MAG TPA: GNAT family acetyltransferase [Candidatus Baltobacteraceae bacterium]|jgi:ribosomal protein S18 acetylase RimI-like enzyme|nr:GNAT family acetyltransferase [Candidatus Baltobacteraceae bacterium]
MITITITSFLKAVHRNQVIALWETVFGYEAAHNDPSLVIDKKVEVHDGLFLVAIADNVVVGTIMGGYDGHRGWIYSLAVSPSHRRQRVGSRLVSTAEQALTARGCMKINLQIMEGNEGVASFYSSLGFSVEKRVSMGKRIPANIPIS